MKFQLTITPRARDDIDRNALWWADHHSIQEALRWSETVYDQLEMLQAFPASHSLSAENESFPYEVRDKRVGHGPRPRYRAVFTILDDEVFVLTVRAGEEARLTTNDVDFDPSHG